MMPKNSDEGSRNPARYLGGGVLVFEAVTPAESSARKLKHETRRCLRSVGESRARNRMQCYQLAQRRDYPAAPANFSAPRQAGLFFEARPHKRKPRCVPGLRTNGSLVLARRPDPIPRHKSRHLFACPITSAQTSDHLDNCHCAGGAKNSAKQEITVRRRKTTTKRSQRRQPDQLPHPCAFHVALDVAPLGLVTQTESTQATQRERK